MVIGVARCPENGVVGLGAEAEFRRIRLADEDRPMRPHARNVNGVRRSDLVLQEWRAMGRRQPLDTGQILRRLRKPMHPAARAALVQFCIADRRLAHQLAARALLDDCVDARIERLDPIKIGAHYLDAGNLAAVDGR
jgi:hypothetical protein